MSEKLGWYSSFTVDMVSNCCQIQCSVNLVVTVSSWLAAWDNFLLFILIIFQLWCIHFIIIFLFPWQESQRHTTWLSRSVKHFKLCSQKTCVPTLWLHKQSKKCGSFVLKEPVVKCGSIPLINPQHLNWHLMDILTDTGSTLDQLLSWQSVENWLIFADMPWSVDWYISYHHGDVNWGSIESINQHSTVDFFRTHDPEM